MKHSILDTFSDPDQLLAKFADSCSDLVIVADRKRRITYVNRCFSDKTGYKPKDLIGANISLLCKKVDEAKFSALVHNKNRDDRKWCGEIKFRKKDGTILRSTVMIDALKDSRGGFSGTVCMGHDMTVEHTLSQLSWQKESRLLSVFESMNDAVCISDIHGKIEMCNVAYCTLSGFSREEIIGIGIPYPWMDNANNMKFRNVIRLAGKEGPLGNLSMNWNPKDGDLRNVSISISPLSHQDKDHDALVITVRDVTDVDFLKEMRRMDAQLSRLQIDVQRKAQRLQTLQDVNAAVLKNADVSKIFKAITSGIKKLVEHDLAGVYAYDSEKNVFFAHTLSKQTPFSKKLSRFPLPIGEGIIGAAAITGRMVWVNNAQLDPRSRYPEGMKPEREHFIAVPLKGRSSVFGILVVARNRNPEFIEEEAFVVKSFADAASVALENARLYFELGTCREIKQRKAPLGFINKPHPLRKQDVLETGIDFPEPLDKASR
jgi:PAS domain S-box-containing protein